MPTVKVKDLNVLAVYVTDLSRSETFYYEHLGFEKCEDLEPGILMKSGRITLYLEAGREKKREGDGDAAEFSPCFATDSVRGSYKALKESGVQIAAEYYEYTPTFAFFRITDPDGNLIEFAGTP